MTPLVPKAEAARRLGVSKDTVDHFRAAGSLPFVRIGGRVMFLAEDIDAFIAAHRVPSTTGTGEGS